MNLVHTTMAALALSTSTVLAGPQYIDSTGYAVSGYDVVAYFDLPQNAIGEVQPPAIPGQADITADYNGALFAFSTIANRDAFIADPEKYVPQYDGHCAYGVAVGGKVPGNPHLWRIVDGKLYLNITENVVTDWEKDIPGYLEKAKSEWIDLEAKDASTQRIPKFRSRAPNS